MSDIKELTDNEVEKDVAALAQLRARIIPQFFQTPVSIFKYLMDKYENATEIRQVLMWDEKHKRLTLVNYAVGEDGKILGPGLNDTRPCPPLWPD